MPIQIYRHLWEDLVCALLGLHGLDNIKVEGEEDEETTQFNLTSNWNWKLGGRCQEHDFFPIMHLCRNVENKVDISRLKSTYGDNVKRRAWLPRQNAMCRWTGGNCTSALVTNISLLARSCQQSDFEETVPKTVSVQNEKPHEHGGEGELRLRLCAQWRQRDRSGSSHSCKSLLFLAGSDGSGAVLTLFSAYQLYPQNYTSAIVSTFRLFFLKCIMKTKHKKNLTLSL